jgi:hypothetical protein
MAMETYGGVKFTQVWQGDKQHLRPKDLSEEQQPLLLCRNEQQPSLALEGAPLRIDGQLGMDLGETPFLRVANSQVALQAPGGLSIQTGSPPAAALTVSAGGDVTIGTTARAGNLEVQGNLKALGLEVSGDLHLGAARLSSVQDNRMEIHAPGDIRCFTGSGAGTERLTVLANGNVGIGTGAPSHRLEVNDHSGIRQNRLYLGGGDGWSSLTYNAFHNGLNNAWIFPDPTRSAVTVEMDDSNFNGPRFDVYSTTLGNTTNWKQLLAIRGDSGNVLMGHTGGSVGIGTTDPAYKLDVADRMRVRQGGSPSAGVWFYQSAPAADRAFVGMVDDNRVGFYGVGAGWGLMMDVTNGTVTKRGGAFKIDHPLDPAKKYLQHSFVESPDMMNIYNDNVQLDESGRATVLLPDWFEALNRDFRYQLTCIGEHAPIYIAEGVKEGCFVVAGGKSRGLVSWQVTGIRKDPWAVDHTIQVEVEKSENERGTYLYPEGYERRNGQHSERSGAVLMRP